MGISAAIVIGAVVSAGSAAYQADQQKKAAKSDRTRREEEAAKEQARLDEIARNTKPEEENLTGTEFGNDDGTLGSYSDFLVPKDKGKKTNSQGASLNGSGSTGGLNSSGGFNV